MSVGEILDLNGRRRGQDGVVRTEPEDMDAELLFQEPADSVGDARIPRSEEEEIVASGKVPAQVMLDRYHGEWDGDISRVYKYSF